MASLKIVTINSCEETKHFARHLASRAESGDVIALYGKMGAGKTTFAQAFIKELLLQEENVVSPTFTLVQTYPTRLGNLSHFDLYRLTQREEVEELGLEEAFAQGVSLVEWPQLVETYLPKETLSLHFTQGSGEEERIITMTGEHTWRVRI